MDPYVRAPMACLVLLAVAACSVSPEPTSVPADLPETASAPADLPAPTGAAVDLPVPSGPLHLSLSVLPERAAAGKVELTLALANDGDQPVYLPICGPWEVHHEGDPGRTVWMGVCEVDYLGQQVAPGGVFADTVQVELDAGRYLAGIRAYGDCTLGAPQAVSAEETNYGAFDDCAVAQEVTSAPIVIE